VSGHNLVSLLGIVVLLGVAWALSNNRRSMNWRVILWGVGLQLTFAALVFHLPGSDKAFGWFSAGFNALIGCAQEGAQFVFGPLATPTGQEGSLGFILAFQGLTLIVFFGSLIAVLYYFHVMDALIRAFSFVFSRLMRVSGAESLCAASNIFVGVESLLTVGPYAKKMTPSELCTILTAGMATIASSVLGLYVLLVGEQVPNLAGHLLSASIISAPAALAMAKILYPETGQPATLGRRVEIAQEQRPANAIEAAINGATGGMTMAIHIAALLIAFIGLVAVLNLLLTVAHVPNLETLLGYVFYPICLVMGIPPEDAMKAGELLGLRLVKTEVPAYAQLAAWGAEGALLPRTQMILSYALCGFAHVASVAIFVGGAVALIPERKAELSRLGLRALVAATLACCLTGAVAGVFYH
jgi:CNT family concentrative nucleoside transporter